MLLPNKGLNLTGWAGGSDGCSAWTSQPPHGMLLPQVKPKVVRSLTFISKRPRLWTCW
jgi:hypothetical protein